MKFTSRRPAAKTLALTLGVALALGSLSMAQAQDVKRAKLGHSFADSHPRTAAMKQFAAGVEKVTQGKVVIDVYGSAMLGSERLRKRHAPSSAARRSGRLPTSPPG